MQTPERKRSLTQGLNEHREHDEVPCIALYCIGVMCSKPGGGTSQYLQVLFFLVRLGEWLDAEKQQNIKLKYLHSETYETTNSLKLSKPHRTLPARQQTADRHSERPAGEHSGAFSG